jgi:two-component system LytT family response regulator
LHHLNTAIYQLRKSLEPHGLKSFIQSNNGSYGMDIADGYMDFVEFEDRLNRFAVIDASNLDQAMEVEKLFVGDLFGEKAFLWTLNDIERLSRMYAAFVKKLAKALLEHSGGTSAVVRLLLKLLDRNEMDEEAVSLILNAYAAQKNRVALTEQYGRYAKLLRKELGMGPSQELVLLYSRLLSELEGRRKNIEH